MKLAIVIPAYNEQERIRAVVESIPAQLEGIKSIRVIIVDDGSVDGTVKELDGLDIIVVRHAINMGLGRTFADGLKKAMELGCDSVVNMDGDGQFDPHDIPKLLRPILNNEADFVTASRFRDKTFIPKMPKIKYWGNIFIAKIISWVLGADFKDVSCGFRAYNKEAVLRMNLFGKFTYTQETILDLGNKGMRIIEVPVVVQYFPGRRSRIAASVFWYGWKTLKIILRTVRDYKPLKFFGILGGVIFLFGLLLDMGLIIFYFVHGSLYPYKFIGFAGSFFNILGIIIFFLGLVADMLYRIRMNQEEILYRLKKDEYSRGRDI